MGIPCQSEPILDVFDQLTEAFHALVKLLLTYDNATYRTQPSMTIFPHVIFSIHFFKPVEHDSHCYSVILILYVLIHYSVQFFRYKKNGSLLERNHC